MRESLVSSLRHLSELGVALYLRDGHLLASPAERLQGETLGILAPWAVTLRKISRKPLTPWRGCSLARAFEGASPQIEQRLANLIDLFDVTGVGDLRDPLLFPAKRGRHELGPKAPLPGEHDK